MATATATAPTTLILPQKFDTLEAVSGTIVLERPTEIRNIILALLSCEHLAMIGEAGIAKSMLTRVLVSLISDMERGDYFEWLLGKFSIPEELFGPTSPKSLIEDDVFRRNTEGKLPRARLAFLDELFKPSEALLNMLLSVLNERLFHNGPDDPNIPLSTLIGCSNEIPDEGSSLYPMWDRILIRLFTRRLQNGANRILMLQGILDRMAGAVPPEPVISWAEVAQAQAEVRQVVVPQTVLDAMGKLWSDLDRQKIFPSDRRYGACLRPVMAAAWREGRRVAEVNDLRVLAPMLWTTVDDMPKVARTIAGIANPLDLEAMVIGDGVKELALQLRDLLASDDSPNIRTRKGMAIHGKLDNASETLIALMDKSAAQGLRSEVMLPIRTEILGLVRILTHEVFPFDETDPLVDKS